MGRNTALDAASALRLLNSEDLRQHPQHGPTERRTASTTPGAPLNLGVIDYLAKTVAEIVDQTTTITPQPKPLPERIEDLYDWSLDNTADADDIQRSYRDTMFEAHRLEHLVRLGETDEVCKHPCPRCGRWGLMWDERGKRAQCSHAKCRTPDGLTSSWTLERLAAQKVRRTEIWRMSAT
ncbi:hypothetical protein [Streptomyces sp. NPDC001492]